MASWARLAKLIGEEGDLRFWKGGGGATTKYIYIYIISKKKKRTKGGLGPPCR